jgi:hypothetical protein
VICMGDHIIANSQRVERREGATALSVPSIIVLSRSCCRDNGIRIVFFHISIICFTMMFFGAI